MHTKGGHDLVWNNSDYNASIYHILLITIKTMLRVYAYYCVSIHGYYILFVDTVPLAES